MRRWLALFLAWLLLCALTANAAPAPIVRTQLTPAQARVGQTLTLSVEVLVPGWFTAPIAYPDLAAAGLAARLSEQSGGNLNERIEGTTYAGIRRDYLLSAAQAGHYQVPALALDVQYNDGGTPRRTTLRTPPREFAVTLPAGAENLGYFIATPRYSLAQTLDRTPEQMRQLKVGDSFTRRLVQRAEGMAAMNLPALQFGAPPGLAVYPSAAQLNDSGGERGAARVGERVQDASYLLREPGRYELPALKIAWYDPAADRLRWASVPALGFEVAPNPAAMPPALVAPPAAAPTNAGWRSGLVTLRRSGPVAALIVLLALGVWRGYRPALAAWQAARRRYAESERAAFRRCRRRLRRARDEGDAALALQAARAWLCHSDMATTLAAWSACHGDASLQEALESLQQDLYAPSASTRLAPANRAAAIARFAATLPLARRRWLAARRISATQPLPATLAPLNPPPMADA